MKGSPLRRATRSRTQRAHYATVTAKVPITGKAIPRSADTDRPAAGATHSATTYASAVGTPTVTRLLIGVTIVTEVNIAIYDARSGPTRDRVATGVSRGWTRVPSRRD